MQTNPPFRRTTHRQALTKASKPLLRKIPPKATRICSSTEIIRTKDFPATFTAHITSPTASDSGEPTESSAAFSAVRIKGEITQKKWFWGGIALQLGTGYTIGFLVYQVGTLIVTGSIGEGFVGGLIFVLAFVATLIFLCIRTDLKIKSRTAAKKVK